MATAPKKKSTKSETAKAVKSTGPRKFVPLITRHRPKRFKDLIGMANTANTLSDSIERGDIPNAFLLVGATGCGKTTVARIIARTVMCDTHNACGKCASCTLADELESHPDYTEVNCGEHGKVDDIRSLIQMSNTYPQIGKMRVIVLDEVHRLSGASAEAILKPLEEPAERTLWILATTEANAIKDTIKNRCNIIPIRPADTEQLGEYLADLARDYISYPGEDLVEMTTEIAQMTGGYIRHALTILDTVIKSYLAHDGKMDVEEFLDAVRTEILSNTDVDVYAAQKLIMAVMLYNPKALLSVLGGHADFVGLSRNLVHLSQYLLDDLLNISGSNIYHPPAFRNTASALSERLADRGVTKTEAKMNLYTRMLDTSVDLYGNVMKFTCPERPLISSTLMNLLVDLRPITKKEKGSDTSKSKRKEA